VTFPNSVRADLATGIPGEFALEGDHRARPVILNSTLASDNVVGARYFTLSAEGVALAGGTGAMGGILANPKVYALYGTSAGGPLAPTLTLPNGLNAELVYSTPGIFVTLPAAAAIGDEVIYNTTTGVLSTQAPGATPGAGLARVPNAYVDHRTVTAAGVAIIRMNN
jgi:hypothetical protein